MRKTFTRVFKSKKKNKPDTEIAIDAHQDFIDSDGIRHPRNVLWLWSDEELWDRLSIRVDWQQEPSEMLDVIQPYQIPTEPLPPAPIEPIPEPLPPAPPAPPPADVPPPHPAIIAIMDSLTPAEIKNAGYAASDEILAQIKSAIKTEAEISTLMAFGGIAVRTLKIAKKHQYHQGHRHNYDHLTNLVRGSVLCEVDDCEPMIFDAKNGPVQITIDADKWHKFTALEDDVIYQCVYSQPDRIDVYDADNSPYGYAPFTKEELLERIKGMDNPCAHCSCEEGDDDVRPAKKEL